MAEEQREGFVNLRKIHDIQVSGSVQGLIRDLRSTRVQLDQILSEAQRLKKKSEAVVSDAPKESEVIKDFEERVENVKKEEVVVEAKETKLENIEQRTFEKPFNRSQRQFDGQKEFNRPFTPRPYDNNQRSFNQNNQRPYDNQRPYNQNSQRPYDNQRAFNQNNQKTPHDNQRPFNPNGPRPYDNQRPFNPNGPRPYDNQRAFNPNGPRSFNPNGPRPFNPNGPRPFNKPTGTGFAPSKENNYRSFIGEEVVPIQPVRTVGNKNKSPNRNTQGDQQERRPAKQRESSYKNIIVNDSDGFEEMRMGSRKLIKNKRQKEEVFVAPKVEHAVVTTEKLTVKTLSEKTGKSVTEIIKKLFILGIMATINSTIDFETAELIASEFGVQLELKVEKSFEEQLKEKISVDSDEEAITRPPVVTVMGHVDHGKTSLLDAVRKTNIALGEAGGITQKIGAYSIVAGGKKITFIDTPGHAAFTSMRIRGAKVTDVAILVVAADDGVMPQTEEAINHIKSAGVPMIVAINKMDKPTANIEKIKQQLADKGVLSEEWGGDTIFVPISAKTGMGIDKLLETVHLVAEVQDLKANPKRMATGVVIEAELDKNRGPVASVLIQNGTLRVGDNIVSGLTYGKVRALYDDKGNVVKEAGPSVCVSVLGFYEVPTSGDAVSAIDEKLSKQVIQERKNKIKEERTEATAGVSLDDFMSKVNEGKLKTLNVIVKADVQGSAEALVQTLSEIKNDEVKVSCIHGGVGFVTESDVLLAKASSAIIIAFNVKTGPKALQFAKTENVEIKNYNIIYNVVDDLTAIISGMQTIKYEQVTIGHAEVRAMFKLSSVGFIVGCYITDGKATRNSFAKVYRGKDLICESQIESLKVVKDEKAEVPKGFECGIRLKDGNLVQVEDTIEFYENVPIKNK